MLPSVDWQTAASCSRAFSRGGPRISPEGALDVVADLHRHARKAIDLVTDYTGLVPESTAPVDVVDRVRWSQINIAGFRRLLIELGAESAAPNAPVTAAAKVTGVQTGAVLAFLSSRVLGQFETFSSDTGRLLFVAPNIVEVERRLRLPSREFRLWIAVHEAAHLTQFTAVPWMREHFHQPHPHLLRRRRTRPVLRGRASPASSAAPSPPPAKRSTANPRPSTPAPTSCPRSPAPNSAKRSRRSRRS